MDKVILEKLKNKPPLPDDITKVITIQARLFGSCLFGGFTQDSDFDFIIPPNFPYSWLELSQYGVVNQVDDYSNMELSSIYVRSKSGKILNLLFIHDNFYDIYLEATDIMVKIVDNPKIHNLIQNKTNRIALFQTIKEMLVEEECNKPVKE